MYIYILFFIIIPWFYIFVFSYIYIYIYTYIYIYICLYTYIYILIYFIYVYIYHIFNGIEIERTQPRTVTNSHGCRIANMFPERTPRALANWLSDCEHVSGIRTCLRNTNMSPECDHGSFVITSINGRNDFKYTNYTKYIKITKYDLCNLYK